jgi:hypothetical protein
MSSLPSEKLCTWLVDAAQAAASVANYCDHVEHNESTERSWVSDAATSFRRLSIEMADAAEDDIQRLYVARIAQIEERNALWDPDRFNGSDLAAHSTSWRGLQLAQIEHDRHYHPDIVGLAKADQLRHCALHLAKLVGALADLIVGEVDEADFRSRRLPDFLLFGLKLATLGGEKLPDQTILVDIVSPNLVTG